jgi:hypothetical protein
MHGHEKERHYKVNSTCEFILKNISIKKKELKISSKKNLVHAKLRILYIRKRKTEWSGIALGKCSFPSLTPDLVAEDDRISQSWRVDQYQCPILNSYSAIAHYEKYQRKITNLDVILILIGSISKWFLYVIWIYDKTRTDLSSRLWDVSLQEKKIMLIEVYSCVNRIYLYSIITNRKMSKNRKCPKWVLWALIKLVSVFVAR